MGGNEITRFAVRYPDRVLTLVYLDSGYDFADTWMESIPESRPEWVFAGMEAATATLDSYLEYWRQRLPWSPGMEANFRAEFDVGPTGEARYRVPDHAIENLLASLTGYEREYSVLLGRILRGVATK